MAEVMKLHFEVNGDDFTRAGEVSSKVKKTLNQLGFNPEVVRKVAIAMYEGEINMVIHADGGDIDVEISSEEIVIVMKDVGPGIPDLDMAMQEGFSTADHSVRELGFGAGMGLPNMKKYSDSMKIDTEIGKGTTVTLTVSAKVSG